MTAPPDPPLASLRREFTMGALDKADALADPIAQFHAWLDAAIGASLPEPSAMTLATCTPDGVPSARIVLLKGCDAAGFVFYTNRESHKGRELAANPRAALVFHWVELERQVRVQGTVALVDDGASDAYFASRPRGSQLGAIASHQSAPVASRAVLEARLAELSAEYADGRAIPRPREWGGYRVVPTVIEFWQGRRNRLHDRLRYSRDDVRGGGWVRERLAP